MEAEPGIRAYPIREAFDRLGVGVVKGYDLVNSGDLETFMIGRRRYATDEALRRLIQQRIAESLSEPNANRANRVANAVHARARRREARKSG